MTYVMRGRYWEDFRVGDVVTTASRTIIEGDISLFAGLSGDFNPLHMDQVLMSQTPFGTRIAHGMLIASISTGQLNQLGLFEGTTIALTGMTLKWTVPVRPGDTIRTTLTVTGVEPHRKPDRGLVHLDVRVHNQRDEQCMESQQVVLVKRRAAHAVTG